MKSPAGGACHGDILVDFFPGCRCLGGSAGPVSTRRIGQPRKPHQRYRHDPPVDASPTACQMSTTPMPAPRPAPEVPCHSPERTWRSSTICRLSVISCPRKPRTSATVRLKPELCVPSGEHVNVRRFSSSKLKKNRYGPRDGGHFPLPPVAAGRGGTLATAVPRCPESPIRLNLR
jgi:hypothetical protein